MKGLRVNIFKSRSSNDSGFDTLTLVGEGVPEVSEPTEDAPAVRVEQHNAGIQYGLRAILVDGVDSPAAFVCKGTAGRNWPMSSGCFISTTDSRFHRLFSEDGNLGRVTIPLHNRYEVA